MKKKIVFVIINLIIIIFSFGCAKKNKPNNTPDFYGPEIYNASYAAIPGEMVRHVIPIMSKNDISSAESFDVEVAGGTCNLQCDIEKTDYILDGYTLYRVILDFSDILFDTDRINISEIKIFTDSINFISLIPDKCEVIKVDGIYNVEYVNINGSPLKLPYDLTRIPLELSSDYNVDITNVYITNNSMALDNYNNGTVTDKFQSFSLKKGSGIVNWQADFIIQNTEKSKYKQYGTSIIIEYEYDGQTFYTVPAVPATIYNPFDVNYDSISLYYNELRG